MQSDSSLFKPLSSLLNLLYPSFCAGCGLPGSALCDSCRKGHLSYFCAQQCHVCGGESYVGLTHRDCAEQSSLAGVLVAYNYDPLAQKLVKQVKYSYAYQLCSTLVDLMLVRLEKQLLDLAIDMVSFVPTTLSRRRSRGFDQAEMLARVLADQLGLPFVRLLTRQDSASQVGRSVIERSLNVHGQYCLLPVSRELLLQTIAPRVLLLDDVMTTGATLECCAAQVKRANPVALVYGAVFARNPQFALANTA